MPLAMAGGLTLLQLAPDLPRQQPQAFEVPGLQGVPRRGRNVVCSQPPWWA